MDKTKNSQVITGCVVDCDELRMRREPNLDSEILMTISVGSRLKLIKESPQWFKVIRYRGTTGYVCADYISILNL